MQELAELNKKLTLDVNTQKKKYKMLEEHSKLLNEQGEGKARCLTLELEQKQKLLNDLQARLNEMQIENQKLLKSVSELNSLLKDKEMEKIKANA